MMKYWKLLISMVCHKIGTMMDDMDQKDILKRIFGVTMQ